MTIADFEAERVLLVTDDPSLRETLESALEPLRLDIASAIDVNGAIEGILERPPALLCVDLALPRDSGYVLCDFVRGDPSLKGVQILIMSDHASPPEMAHAEEAGANAFVRKPFTATLLRRYVNAILERRRPSQTKIRELRPSEFPPR